MPRTSVWPLARATVRTASATSSSPPPQAIRRGPFDRLDRAASTPCHVSMPMPADSSRQLMMPRRRRSGVARMAR